MSLGVPEVIIIVVVALLFFGPSRLPSLGKSVGEAIRGFKKGLSGGPDDDNKEKLQSSGRGADASADASGISSESVEKKKEHSDV
jgi:sec-independent protein translocase protein TatA